MRRNYLLAVTLFCMAGCNAMCGQTIEPGHVGLLVNNMGGSEKGAIETINGPNRVWVPPFHRLYDFNTTYEMYIYTDSVHEGKEIPEAFQFQTTDGSVVHAPLALQFHVPPENVMQVFQKYRRELPEIRDFFIRNMIREALNEVTSQLSVNEAIGPKKEFIVTEINRRVREKLASNGIVLDSLTLVGAFIPPEAVTQALNSKLAATQEALRVQNQVAQSRAQAEKDVAEAEGKAKSRMVAARAQADSTLMQAEAEAKANLLIRQSLTPELVRLRAVEKWNGTVPQFSGGASPIPFLQIKPEQ